MSGIWSDFIHNYVENSYNVEGLGSMWVLVPVTIALWILLLGGFLAFVVFSARGVLHRLSFWAAKNLLGFFLLCFALHMIHRTVHWKFGLYVEFYLSNFNHFFAGWAFLLGSFFLFVIIGITASILRCMVQSICPLPGTYEYETKED